MSDLTKPLANYAHAKSFGPLVFLAGQGARDPLSNKVVGLELGGKGEVVSYDIKAQTEQVLTNIETALRTVELNIGDLIDVTVFLNDMKDYEEMNQVWNDWFNNGNYPTRTCVAVRELPAKNFVEMKAVAARQN